MSHQFLGLCSYCLLMQFTGHSCWEARGKLSCLGSGCEAGIVHCPEQTEPVLAHAQAVRKVWFLSVCDFILMELLLGESTYLGQIFIWHFGLLFFLAEAHSLRNGLLGPGAKVSLLSEQQWVQQERQSVGRPEHWGIATHGSAGQLLGLFPRKLLTSFFCAWGGKAA